jgi:hypothetical protein
MSAKDIIKLHKMISFNPNIIKLNDESGFSGRFLSKYDLIYASVNFNLEIFDYMNTLCLRNSDITNADFSTITKICSNLSDIDMFGCENITNIIPLENNQNIKFLNICHTNVKDISPLKNCQNLHSLDISHTGIKDISCLRNKVNIRSLDMSSTKINDISCLSSCISLQELRISYGEVSNIDIISNFPNLTLLYMERTNIIDFSPIRNTNIRYLGMSLMKKDLSFIPNTVTLLHICVDSFEVDDLTFISDLIPRISVSLFIPLKFRKSVYIPLQLMNKIRQY